MSDFNPHGQPENNRVPTFDQSDIEANKTMAGLAYILFFLPLVVSPNSPFGRFHANQGLLLLILGIAGNIILTFLPLINLILWPIFGLFVLVLFVIGLVNGFGGKAKELPLIGSIRLIK